VSHVQITAFKTPVVQLEGEDGNAFAILGRWQSAARDAGWPPDQVKRVMEHAMSGDYGHLLQTVVSNSEQPE